MTHLKVVLKITKIYIWPNKFTVVRFPPHLRLASLALQKFHSSSLLPFSNHKKLTNVTISITQIVIDTDRTNKKVAVSIFIQCSAVPTVHKLLMH